MKEKIKEIQEYFIQKLLNGEFEIRKGSDSDKILIVDEYKINIWHKGKIGYATLFIDLFDASNIEYLLPELKEFDNQQKIKEIEKLQNELNNK